MNGKPLLLAAVLVCAVTSGMIILKAEEPGPTPPAPSAQTLFDQGHFKEAFEAAQVIAIDPSQSSSIVTRHLKIAVESLARLSKIGEIDELFSEVHAAHPGNVRIQLALAKNLNSIPHYGFITAGTFERGDARGTGTYVGSDERDRVQCLMWLEEARKNILSESDYSVRADVFEMYAAILAGQAAWKLQRLTQLEVLPDYDETQPRWWGGRRGGMFRGGASDSASKAPVDSEGTPVYYHVPQSFEEAKNDGERWRWMLVATAESDTSRLQKTRLTWAQFLIGQFDVQTLVGSNINLYGSTDGELGSESLLSLAGLSDDETIAMLATGVKRFKLPEEFQYIKILKEIAESNNSELSEQAFGMLSSIYVNRLQYPKAVEQLQKSIEKHPNRPESRQSQIQQIVGNWGEFVTSPSRDTGKNTTLAYRFRNGKSVSLTAHELKINEFINDIQTHLKSRPTQIDWEKMSIESIGQLILNRDQKKYLGAEVANWKVELTPRENHFDRQIEIKTPLEKAGAYLITSKMQDGNSHHLVMWVNDTAIVKKQVAGKPFYFIADAETGQPIAKAKVEFFGWGYPYQEGRQNRTVSVKQFAELSDANGFVSPAAELFKEENVNRQWMTIARTDQGRLAYLGFEGIWINESVSDNVRLNELKLFVVGDRPVYRPGQTVELKSWLRRVSYGETNRSEFTGQELEIIIYDPLGNEVKNEALKTDEHSSAVASFVLPAGAQLGSYSVNLTYANQVTGHLSFLVEEYKKPEYEVSVEAPTEPVKLGETFKAKILAKYYYGAPVTQATVKYKVERVNKNSRWFPTDRWDWLYGNGYWWFAAESTWHPGFRSWGCLPPFPGWSFDPPEVVLEREVEIGPDGVVEVEIDTTLAKELHGNQDHEYKISAEVVDASRRTIVGNGAVNVSRQPYQIFVWTDRGFYSVGQKINASFQARALSGKGIQASGQLELLKITFDGAKPVETSIKSWAISTDETGSANQTLDASEPGMYRLSLKLKTSEEAPEIEGGYIFNVRGQGFNSNDFKFTDLELIPDQKTYQPGETVKVQLNTNRRGSTVLVFSRPTDGMPTKAPQVFTLNGKSVVIDLKVTPEDMPNFFIEALTISNGVVHNITKEIVVPPVSKVLNLDVIPSTTTYLPGQEAEIEVRVTDLEGKPFSGSLALTVYDRAIEYISGGSNVQDIKEFFWSWKRSHYISSSSNLTRGQQIVVLSGAIGMQTLGQFGGAIENMFSAQQELSFGGMGGMGGGMLSRSSGVMMRAAPSAAAVPESARDQEMSKQMDSIEAAPADGAETVQPSVRSDFADAAFWAGNLTADANGFAKVQFKMPENLSSWKIKAWGVGKDSNVGEGSTEVVTTKNIIVRLQAPRFFVERDEVVLSAVVHNYLKEDQEVDVQLELGGETLELIAGEDGKYTSTPSLKIQIPAGGEHRVDWLVKATQAGEAIVTMKALTNVESDAMKMTFPVNVRGTLKTDSYSRSIAATEPSKAIEFVIPEDRNPLQSRLEVRYSPTLAGAMVDALPYLVSYPYGCTEQTLNRFIPTVITQQMLMKMGVNLKQIQEKRTNLNAQQLGDPEARAAQWKSFESNPVFSEDEVDLMVKKGVQDLISMQNSDGGWGWFSGYGEQSWPHTTAVVVHGLQLAIDNDIALPDGVLSNGIEWLEAYQTTQIALLKAGDEQRKDPKSDRKFRSSASELDALIFGILVKADINEKAMQDYIYRDRLNLSLYGQTLVGLALHETGAIAERDMVIRNIDQFLKVDDENQTAYIDLPNNTYWGYWYGSQIEANAQYLKLLTKVDAHNAKAAGLAKYLINNRRNGYYWNNTRDTAYVIEALAGYAIASGETQPNMLVEVVIDGEVKKSVEITPEVLFSFDNVFTMEGEALTSGKHILEIRRSPLVAGAETGPLYFNAYVTNFTKEDRIAEAGLEIKVQRKFFKLTEEANATVEVAGSRGQVIDQKVKKYTRTELDNLSQVVSGDLIEIELAIDSKNDYEYVIFEDFKAAGTEAVDLQSGYSNGRLGAYVEFRDQKVVFFLRQLSRGQHSVSYRVRAEIPGTFSALPALAEGMYAPELKANSTDLTIKIEDKP